MLTSLYIKNFRGFKKTTIDPLKRVNLIMGQNNSGKTGMLEALFLLLAGGRIANLPSLFRSAAGDPNENFWKWIHFNKDPKNKVEITAKFDNTIDFGVTLGKTPTPLGAINQTGRIGAERPGPTVSIISTCPSNPKQDAIDYNRVVLRRKKKQVEGLLKNVEPRLQAIESLQTGNEPLLYADIGLSEMFPITQMGQGFIRLLRIYSELVAAEANVLLIDEIENGLHHSVLPTIWKGLFHAAEEVGLQLFATTHSWECVLAADEAAGAEPGYDLNLIRLDRVDDNIKATIIDKEALNTAKELQWELR